MAYPTTVRLSVNMTGSIGYASGTTPTNKLQIYDADPGAGVAKRVKPAQVADGFVYIDNVSGIYQGASFISPGNSAAGIDDVSNGGAGTAGAITYGQTTFFFRRQQIGSDWHYIRVDFGLSDGSLAITTTRSSGSYVPVNRIYPAYLDSGYPPTYNIVNGNRHECKAWIEDNGVGGESLRVTITDLTASVVQQDLTYTLHAEDSTDGEMGFITNTLLTHYEYVEFAETPILVGPPTQTVTKTSTAASTSLFVTPAGGNGAKTVSVLLGDGVTEHPDSPQSWVSGALEFTQTGLTPGYHYVYYVTTTDSTPGTPQSVTLGVDIFTRPPDPVIPTVLRLLAIGDSITVGTGDIQIGGVSHGSVRVDAAALEILRRQFNIAAGSYDSVAVAQSGATPEQIADLLDEAYLVAAGGYAGGNTYGGTLNGAADTAFIRVGKNWSEEVGETAQEAADRCVGIVQDMITGLLANTDITKVIIGLVTGYGGSGDEGAMASTDRQYLTNQGYIALHNPAGGVWVESEAAWYPPILNYDLIPDYVHPITEYRGALVLSLVSAYNSTIYDVPGGGSSGGGSGEGTMTLTAATSTTALTSAEYTKIGDSTDTLDVSCVGGTIYLRTVATGGAAPGATLVGIPLGFRESSPRSYTLSGVDLYARSEGSPALAVVQK